MKFVSVPPPHPQDPLQAPEGEPTEVEAQAPESSQSAQGEEVVLVEDASSSDEDGQTLQQRFEVKSRYGYSGASILSGLAAGSSKRPASSLVDDVTLPPRKKRTTVGKRAVKKISGLPVITVSVGELLSSRCRIEYLFSAVMA